MEDFVQPCFFQGVNLYICTSNKKSRKAFAGLVAQLDRATAF